MIKTKQSFFLEQDQLVVAKAIHSKLVELKPSDFQNAQFYFSAIKGILPSKDLKDLDPLRELLFEKLLLIKSTHATFQPLWAIYSATLKAHFGKERSSYFEHCMRRLKEELKAIINQKAHYSQRGVAQFDAINRFTLIVRSFV